ncbi:MAG: GTP-binding protein [Flavobacteriia bacterium]|nr:GTP-binding protein [Flavobacteriia bacterium]
MELLRFFTAGNVDDGKSTLIGRLLYDSNSISTDIIETLTKQSKVTGIDTEIDLALLTDGLRAEREQGITIDVAYKYFSTDKRKFIIADTPGHAQYTRNMFTGASNAELAIILVDARNGITDQTKRHSIIASILGIPHVLVCVNKMDLVNYNEALYEQIQADFSIFAKQLNLKKISFIPASALAGDNVVSSSENMIWYKGPSLLEFLEEVEIERNVAGTEARFQVQYVVRPQTDDLHDYRGYAGNILSGSLKIGDKIKVFPTDAITTITRIESNLVDVKEAFEGQPVIIHIQDDLDVSRGATFVRIHEEIISEREVKATICWMDNKAFVNGQKLLLQQNSFRTKAVIKDVQGKLNIHTNEHLESDGTINLNDFCKVLIKTADSVSYDAFQKNRKTGSFILINENTNNTVAAGIIENDVI